MDNQTFSRQMSSAQNQLHRLLDQLNQLTSGERKVAEQAVEALSQSLAELHVAQEELHQQNAELRAVQQALAAERRRYQELFALAPDGYLVTDAGGVIQEANRAAAAQLGVREDRLRGKPMALFVPRDDQAAFYALVNRLRRTATAQAPGETEAAGHQRASIEIRLQSRSGDPFPAAITVAPVHDGQGTLTAIRWLVRDVTARKEAEAQLQFQAHLLDAVEQAVIVTDPEGRVVYWNPYAEELYGWSAAEARGRTTVELIAPENREESIKHMQCLQNGDSYEGEYLARHRDGTPLPIEVTVTPIRDAEQRITHLIGISADISQRKASRAKLEAALAQKEILLREVHHRVKNSLTIAASLLGFQAMEADDAAVEAMLNSSQQRLSAIARVHEHLYQSDDLRAIAMRDYLTSLTSHVRASMGRPDVTLTVEAEDVQMDLDHASTCGLIVNELVTNAYKHAFPYDDADPAASDREIRVILRYDAPKAAGESGDDPADAPPDELVLAVSDTGVGADGDAPSHPSMGMQVVQMMTAKLKGIFRVCPTPDTPSGATFEVIFPYPKSPTP
jgi:PAS domain S-box-containing protein